MSRFDMILTASTVIAGTIAVGLFVRTSIQGAGSVQQGAALMQLAEPTVMDASASAEPRVIAAPEAAPGNGVSADGLQASSPSASSLSVPSVIEVRPESSFSFDDRPLKVVKTINMKVTAYSPDARSCGKWADGITFSGKSVWTNGMQLVAADRRVLPIGSVISVPGYAGGRPVPVLDIGGAIKGNRLDVLFPTHAEARQWGVRTIQVVVYAYAD